MSEAWRYLRAAVSGVASRWRDLLERLSFATGLGIAWRLSFAFAAVAALALAAHSITERGSSLLIRAIEATPPSAPPADEPAGTEPLPIALDRFQLAALAHIDPQDRERLEARDASLEALEAAHAAYAAGVRSLLGPAAIEALDRDLASHRLLGLRLARAADARQRLVGEFGLELGALDSRLKSALNGVWQSDAKLAARGPLGDASRHVDQLRKHSAGFAVFRGYGPAAARGAVATERALATLLAEQAPLLAGIFGEEWHSAARRELARLARLRGSLMRTDRMREGWTDAFSSGYAALSAQVRRLSSQVEAARAVAAVRQQSAEALTAVSRSEERRRTLLAWLIGLVLLVLLAITVTTVASVVRPVRRLLAATQRLARGDPEVAVPRGGIRELDTLAVSFNRMAEQLTAAQALTRRHQGELEAKVAERTRQLVHLAAHDPLTRLPNRRQLMSRLGAVLREAAGRKERVGVFFIDLDHFKNLNDGLGHEFGDRVLQAVSARLRAAAAPPAFSARLGGDEFTVVSPGATRPDELERAGRRLVRAFQDPLVIDGRELLVGLSVGASVFPDHGNEPEALLRAADAAMFHAKGNGRSQLRLFSPELLDAAASKFSIEQGLRRAVERGEFELHFQPDLHLATFESAQAEALLRWHRPDHRHESPDDFLRVAEEFGLIHEIGDWVLQSAIGHAQRWHAGAWPAARVSVNVSSLQLMHGRFLERVQALLGQHRLPPECLEIELTESVLQTGQQTIESVRQLRRAGIGVALDDFGTGYSSLVSLEQLPLSRVKLDRSLVATIDTSDRSQAITRAIIGLCQSLGLQVTAEGIERREQLLWFLDHPATHLQGHLLSPPVAGGELLPVLAALPARLEELLRPDPPTSAVQFARYRAARRRPTG